MKTAAPSELFRKLPSVDDVMRAPEASSLAASYGHECVVVAARSVLARFRQEITSGFLDENSLQFALSGIWAAIEKELSHARRYSLLPLINPPGVLLSP